MNFNFRSRKFIGFILTNVLLLIVSLSIVFGAPEILLAENTFVVLVGGFLLNMFFYVFGNVISKFAPQVIREVLTKEKDGRN